MKAIKFSATFLPTALFSLKDSNATNSGAKSLFIPSPYAIKMSIINQAIILDNIDFKSNGRNNDSFATVRDMRIEYRLRGNFCVNKCFLKILKPSRSEKGAMQETVSFREYIHISEPIELIFEVSDTAQKDFIKKYLHKVNYFGKRGCFFQFVEYSDSPSNINVHSFDSKKLMAGILQEHDDFHENWTFEHIDNYGGKNSVKRAKKLFVLPIIQQSASKSYANYKVMHL